MNSAVDNHNFTPTLEESFVFNCEYLMNSVRCFLDCQLYGESMYTIPIIPSDVDFFPYNVLGVIPS